MASQWPGWEDAVPGWRNPPAASDSGASAVEGGLEAIVDAATERLYRGGQQRAWAGERDVGAQHFEQ